jgi:putative FmdB family regulatory protein
MPTYEYECQKCQHRYELFQRITEAPKKSCPECKGRVKRLLGTGAGLLFKGSGFYITDYRKPGYKQAAKNDSGGGVSTTKSAETKSAAIKPSETKTKGTKD